MEAQRLIALSLGKIALSRQQRGGINLHKNLLVASVLHRARTTYMVENFQSFMDKRSESQRAVVNVEEPPKTDTNTDNNTVSRMEMNESSQTVSMNDLSEPTCNTKSAPIQGSGDNQVSDTINKENQQPSICDSKAYSDQENIRTCDSDNRNRTRSSCAFASSRSGSTTTETEPVACVVPLQDTTSSTVNVLSSGGDYVSRLSTSLTSDTNSNSNSNTCRRCIGGKRRRSFVEQDSAVLPKKPKMDDENNEPENQNDRLGAGEERMQIEHTQQITNLVTIFSGLYKTEGDHNSTTNNSQDKVIHSSPGQVNVYVTTERSTGHTFTVPCDVTCGTQLKDRESVSMPTVIALAV